MLAEHRLLDRSTGGYPRKYLWVQSSRATDLETCARCYVYHEGHPEPVHLECTLLQ